MHSRFEHSLGVMELATQAFDLLAVRHDKRLEEELKAVPELTDRIMERVAQGGTRRVPRARTPHPITPRTAKRRFPLQRAVLPWPGNRERDPRLEQVGEQPLAVRAEARSRPLGIGEVALQAVALAP